MSAHGEVLHLHLDPRRRPLHRRDHGRLHFGIRSRSRRSSARSSRRPTCRYRFKDWTGNEISRVYADQWGAYNGLTYSTWEVNPPNPTGYAPTMMVMCMNDPGPIPDPVERRSGSAVQPGLQPVLLRAAVHAGQTQYMDTPVVPTSAFAGAGYNNPDCAYPDCHAGDQRSGRRRNRTLGRRGRRTPLRSRRWATRL